MRADASGALTNIHNHSLEGEDASVEWASEWRPCAPRMAGDGGPRLKGTDRVEDGEAGADRSATTSEAEEVTAADERGSSSDSSSGGADAARGALRDAASGDDAAEGEPHAAVARCDAAVQCDGASASGPDRSRDDGSVVPAPEPPEKAGGSQRTPTFQGGGHRSHSRGHSHDY